MDDLLQAVQKAMAAGKPGSPPQGIGPKIQALYDALTPLAQLIKEVQESQGVGEATAHLAAGLSGILKGADDLAVAGLVLDLLWKVADKETSP